MATQPRQTGQPGFFQELAVEFRRRQFERDVHQRTVCHRRTATIKPIAAVERSVEQRRLGAVDRGHGFQSADLGQQPAGDEQHDVDGKDWRRVEIGVRGNVRPVIEEAGQIGRVVLQQPILDDDDGDAG